MGVCALPSQLLLPDCDRGRVIEPCRVFLKEGLSLSFPSSPCFLLLIEYVCLRRKGRWDVGRSMWCKKLALRSLSLWEALGKERKTAHAKRCLCFLGGFLYYLRWTFWLCWGRIVCVCVHTQSEINRARYVAARGPCPAMLPACTRQRILQLLHHSCLSQTYPADSRLHNVLLLFWLRGSGAWLSAGSCYNGTNAANSKGMQEIKEIYVFLRIWMTGEESLIWLWTLVIYLEPWSKTPIPLKSIKILPLNSMETGLLVFFVRCQRKEIVENIHWQHFHICLQGRNDTVLPQCPRTGIHLSKDAVMNPENPDFFILFSASRSSLGSGHRCYHWGEGRKHVLLTPTQASFSVVFWFFFISVGVVCFGVWFGFVLVWFMFSLLF